MLKQKLQKIYKSKAFYIITSFLLHIFFLYCFYFSSFSYAPSFKEQNQIIDLDLDFKVGGTKHITPLKKKQAGQNHAIKKSKKKVLINNQHNNKAITKDRVKLTNTNQKNILLKKSTATQKTEETDIFAEEHLNYNGETIIPNSDYIKAKIEQYRNFTYLVGGKSAKSIEIVVLIKLNIDGSVKSIINLYDNAGFFVNENIRKALIYQNRRAIMLASPFDKLDPKDFEKWKEVKIRFTLKD